MQNDEEVVTGGLSYLLMWQRSRLPGVNHLLHPMSRFSQVEVGILGFIREIREGLIPRLVRHRGLYLCAFVPLVEGSHGDDLGVGGQGRPPSEPIIVAPPSVTRILPIPRPDASIWISKETK